MSSSPLGVLLPEAKGEDEEEDEGVPGALRAEVLGRMWEARMLVTSEGVGMGGL